MSVVIVGAGPNLGAAVARRFGREGMPVGLIARDRARLDALAAELTATGLTADVATADIRDPGALSAAIGALAEHLGPVEVLEYSPLPAREFMKPILETTVEGGEESPRDRGIHVGHTAIGGRIAPGADHEPDDVAEVLWRHHTERTGFQVRLGIDGP